MTRVDGTPPVHSGIGETSNPDPSENSGTSINGVNRTSTPAPRETSAAPPIGDIWRPRIGNIRQ